MKKDKKILEMREKLIRTYPSGFIRGQKIIDMPDCQIYAIYKYHTMHRIPTNKPRMKKPEKQIPGQLNIFERM